MKEILVALVISSLVHIALFTIPAVRHEGQMGEISIYIEPVNTVNVSEKGHFRKVKGGFQGNIKGSPPENVSEKEDVRCEEVDRGTEANGFPLIMEERPPSIKKLVKPSYTSIAREMGIEGTVIVELIISEDGRAVYGRVVKGLGYGLDEEALNSLMKSEYEPATVNGSPVSSKVVIPVRFELRD